MNQQVHFLEADIMEQAMTNFMLAALDAKQKTKNIRINMEFRRKLEIKREQLRLQKDIAEYEFLKE
jgi:hypothetical protein